MIFVKYLSFRLAAFGLLVSVGSTVARSNDETVSDLSTNEIFQKTQQTYASMTSYSDEGTSVYVSSMGTAKYAVHTKLARPNLYRIDWICLSSPTSKYLPPPKAKIAWSTGEGNFQDFGDGVINTPQNTMRSMFDLILTPSIPNIFFRLDTEHDLLMGSLSEKKREADEKVANFDCYVFSISKSGARTVWIGKQDFLIHQIRYVQSAEENKAEFDDAARKHPNTPVPAINFEGVNETETHTNIVINQKFVPADFAH